ncbi:aminopeptidase C. Cysteine peptidase. MEROPS family C01B [Halanaerobium congolense]|jgi:bleomycin hydrolase|uniref:Aminopeptidase n=1 Tax=Halanaerobium congolense TaxID=54121 RepID=A0A1G8K837_9FIRM|nr:C1 family peptidase [Halanaerobium congolense]OEG63287.1 MAG: aminopeptidase [Halanaerobium sp. MDAL1]PUU93567.1 MAG: bleomycin hydrolase [Halanaerobium sp.]SDI39618.1 aminopeptidase C. Cysteine peptidase. MEROPS family C01B [Halanaerobium congolense]SET06293.1 aminopeptidase C. Cysteine peptidase. MEROPS family C01B [Halanaerobium congolense]
MNRQSIDQKNLEDFSAYFKKRENSEIIANAVIKNGINDTALNNKSVKNMHYDFSEEIDVGKVTNQEKSGRCWMFAALNNIRYSISKNLNIKDHDFELSQSYTMFWDKLEKANYFLENIISTVELDLDSRRVMWLLNEPTSDGGQWDMFTALIEKYGIVPKYVMPETYHSSNSPYMNKILSLKLRDLTKTLRNDFKLGADKESLREEKEAMLAEIYSILAYFLGEPPQKFDFEYKDKDGEFYRDSGLTPKEFYNQYSKVKMADYVSIINAPTKDKPFDQTYTVEFLGNVKEGQQIHYLNLPIEKLIDYSTIHLKDGEPVWFGCDVGQWSNRDLGIMDTNLFNYESVLDTNFSLDKGERLQYGESILTHAMVFTGVNLDDQNQAERWKVQNSWGEKVGDEGFFIMSNDWFKEFNYEVVIHKKYLSDEDLKSYQKDPVILKPWDPMGSLAKK